MRRTQHTSPLPPDARGREDVIRPPANRTVSAAVGADSDPAAAGRQGRRQAAGQFAAVIAIMTGLWVAISPWFLTLQAPRGGNAAANNLIVGLVVVALGILATERLPGRLGLPAASLLAGIWVLISPFVLDAKFSVTAAMYWSNIWAGAVVIVAGIGLLAVCSGLPRTGREMP